VKCGTSAGYHAHRRRDERPCAACLAARYDSTADRNAARVSALGRLAREYPERFQELYVQELARRGLKAKAPAVEGVAPEDLQ